MDRCSTAYLRSSVRSYRSSITSVVRLHVPNDGDELKIDSLARIASPHPQIIRSLSFRMSRVTFSRGSFIHVVDFSREDIRSAPIMTEDDDLDVLVRLFLS
jgi:hypothetical protein